MLIHQVLHIVHHSWLYVSTTTVGLSVYRSTALPHTDEWFDPIRHLLNNEVLSREVLDDENMMFGQGERTIYKLGEL